MVKDAVIQSIVSNGSDVKQVNTIHLYNIDWEFSTRIIMLLLNAVISNSANNKVFTAELIDKSIAKVKDIIGSENKLYNNDIYNDGFTLMDVYTPNPLIDIIDENDAYISIDWCIENDKISLSKTMVKGIESLFERKYISDTNDYKTVTNEIINQMPITDTIGHTKELSIDKTDIAINNTDIQSLRSVYDKYLATPRTDTFHNWLYSPESKVIINITACDVLKQNNLKNFRKETHMIKQLTLSQLYTYIKYNMSTYIVKNTHINQIQIIYAIKIANTPIYTVFDLYSILNCINRDWTNIARDDIMDNFENYIHNEISDNDYKLLCERLRLPESVKDDNYIFDMTYLTDFDFRPCTLEECKLTNNYIKLSNNELLDLCSIPLTDKQRKELDAL